MLTTGFLIKVLLHKYYVEQAEIISSLLLTVITHNL